MPSSPKKKMKREKRIRRNLMAKELSLKRWRQRVKDKDHKKIKEKEIIESFNDDSYIN